MEIHTMKMAAHIALFWLAIATHAVTLEWTPSDLCVDGSALMRQGHNVYQNSAFLANAPEPSTGYQFPADPGDSIFIRTCGTCASGSAGEAGDCPSGIESAPSNTVIVGGPTPVTITLDAGTPPPTTQCDDGLDNDGDTLIDLADPGCLDAQDDDETDPPPGNVTLLGGAEVQVGTALNPAPVTVNIPAGTDLVLMFWSYWGGGASGGLQSATLQGIAPALIHELPAGSAAGTGVVGWVAPPEGQQSLDLAWDTNASDGPVVALAFVSGAQAWQEVLSAQSASGGGSLNLAVQPGAVQLKFDQRYGGTPPGNQAGWTSVLTTVNNIEGARLSEASQEAACNAQTPNYSTLVCVSFQ